MTKLPQKFYYKKNRLQQLKGFYHTVQCGSISKAAIEMGLNQSTVTLQIQALERDLKAKLLERHSKPIQLTKDGKSLYEMSAYYLQGIDNLYEEFLASKNSDRQINIATDSDVINYLLPAVINKFSSKHPAIKLVIKNMNADLALEELKNGRVDIIIYPRIDNLPSQFVIRPYHTFHPTLIISNHHPLAKKKKISIDEINKYNLIRSDNWLLDNELKILNVKDNIRFEGSGSEVVKVLVRQNVGLGLVSDVCLRKEKQGKQELIHKNFSQHFQDINYKLAYKSSEAMVKEIIDFILHSKV